VKEAPQIERAWKDYLDAARGTEITHKIVLMFDSLRMRVQTLASPNVLSQLVEVTDIGVRLGVELKKLGEKIQPAEWGNVSWLHITRLIVDT
jgi:hypothetical protein